MIKINKKDVSFGEYIDLLKIAFFFFFFFINIKTTPVFKKKNLKISSKPKI
jgi:hypothetical protein